LPISIALTLIALFIFGGVKGRLTGVAPVLGAFQTAAVGGLAAVAALGIARLVGGL
jgi:VIT1/CCC1 family predicted Fe2+/Mn2+ transporter